MKQFRANNYTATVYGLVYTDSREYSTAALFVQVTNNHQQKHYILTDDDWLGATITEQTPDGWTKSDDIEEVRKYFRVGSIFDVPPTAIFDIMSETKCSICRIEDYIANDPDNCDWDIIDKYNQLQNA